MLLGQLNRRCHGLGVQHAIRCEFDSENLLGKRCHMRDKHEDVGSIKMDVREIGHQCVDWE
jgi:hypothetical protein